MRVLDSAGESLAAIWLREGSFDRDAFLNLAPDARLCAELSLRHLRPEWLTEL